MEVCKDDRRGLSVGLSKRPEQLNLWGRELAEEGPSSERG